MAIEKLVKIVARVEPDVSRDIVELWFDDGMGIVSHRRDMRKAFERWPEGASILGAEVTYELVEGRWIIASARRSDARG